eukprot:4463131-Amphidinium_carterae.2
MDDMQYQSEVSLPHVVVAETAIGHPTSDDEGSKDEVAGEAFMAGNLIESVLTEEFALCCLVGTAKHHHR